MSLGTPLRKLATVTLVMLLLSAPGLGLTKGSVASQLMKIAEETITTQYEILVSGDGEGPLKNKRYAHLYRKAMKERFASQVDLRNVLLRTKQDFKRFKTEMRLKGVSVNGDTAKLLVTEQTELYMSVPGGPSSMGLVDDHIFEFRKVEGEWELVSDTIPKPSTEPDLSALDNPRSGPPAGPRRDAVFLKAGFAPALRTTYDRSAAVNYAKQYSMNANPAYIIFGGTDCTNFVSQSLNAGGVPQVYGWYRSEDVWFYSCSVFGQTRATASWTWSKASMLYNYFLTHASATQYWVNHYPEGASPGLWPGDIIFADWDAADGTHHPDTIIDHAMFVTGRDTAGNLYISQHSPSRRDQPLAVTHQAEPAAKYEGFHIWDSAF